MLEDHQQNVNGVAFTPDGKALVSAAYDLTLRIWPLDGGAPTVVTLPTPLNSVAIARDGEIVAGGADGRVFFFSPSGEQRGEIDSGQTPIVAVAVIGRRRAGRRRRHPRLGRDHRPPRPQGPAHAGRPRAAGVVGGVPARQSHARSPAAPTA